MKINKYVIPTLFVILTVACAEEAPNTQVEKPNSSQYLTVLGIAQDAGYPQAGCQKSCCKKLWTRPQSRKMVTSLGIVDKEEGKTWLFEATPDFKDQAARLAKQLPQKDSPLPDGIFLTHAHIGHYTGLMHLGHEAMGAQEVPVYAMPKMVDFLTNNGPWSQLVSKGNIALQPLEADKPIQLTPYIKVTPFLVPHRDEYSETVGYKIEGPKKSILFIPDIDKWEKWGRDIEKEVAKVDLALLDGTFYKNGEIKGRDMALIPHPFMEETTKKFREAKAEEKKKICFIHFNHTNPVIDANSSEHQAVIDMGFSVAEEGMVVGL